MLRQTLKTFGAIWLTLTLAACATVSTPPEPPTHDGTSYPEPDVENPGVIIVAEPVQQPQPALEIFEAPKWYSALDFWSTADHRPALKSFKASCKGFVKADPNAELNPNQPEYGRYVDWLQACENAKTVGVTQTEARFFFEDEFAPIVISTREGSEGLLTGYYEPEINVRKVPDAKYSEPILAKPTSKTTQKLERSKLNANSSRVIAYGTPIDVFFMQIQGSGRIKFKDGTSVRAAYAGNNGKKYKSIGKVLVARGEMTVEQASKQAISDWMERSGPAKTRALMNENPRYIFFAEQKINPGEGPRGAMRVPLTAMGSMAVDPRYHPYGTLAWLNTTLPQRGGDFKGQAAGVLVSVQDTGNAIRGPLRGDLFFGSGAAAGDRAGVMKHPVRWTILVPKTLIVNTTTTS